MKHLLTVLVWTACCHFLTLFSSAHLVFGLLSTQIADNEDQLAYFGFVLFIIQGLCFLFYPVMGLLAEVYWTRYKTMLVGTYVQLTGTGLFIVSSLVLFFAPDINLPHGTFVYAMILIPYAIIQLGLAMIESNAIQFGTDQIIDRPSDELSSFVHWYFWAIFVGHGVINCLFLVFLSSQLSLIETSLTVLMIVGVIQITGCLLVIVFVQLKYADLEIQPIGKNPVKLIKNVLMYAYHHPHPVRRSAFTHNDAEQTYRINYGKTRFGGPFHTDEVEDVKAFFRVLVIFLGLLGFRFTDETHNLANLVFALSTSNNESALLHSADYESPWFNFLIKDAFGVSTFTILTGIPIYQLILKRIKVTNRCLPSMLKRMFMGLVCVALAVVVIQVLSVMITLHVEECQLCALQYYPDNSSCNITDADDVYVTDANDVELPFNFNLLVIPQILNGLGFLFVFLTVMEFVLAQAPRRMQSLLIGIWYSLLSINLLIIAVESFNPFTCIPNLVNIVVGIKLSLMVIGLVMYVCVAVRYKPRLRNEPADVDIHLTIARYVSHQILVEQELQEEDMRQKYFSVISSDPL